MTRHGAHDAYRKQQASSWTRIDLVLALYARAEEVLQSLLDGPDEFPQRLQLVRLVMGIRQGLDFRYGELPQRIDQLCEFVQQQALQGDLDQLRATQPVLRTLREAFQEIRDEAAELEARGEISPPPADSSVQRTA